MGGVSMQQDSHRVASFETMVAYRAAARMKNRGRTGKEEKKIG
jgi:hypothetical protein